MEDLNSSIKKKIYFISNYDLIKDQFKKLKYSVEIKNVKGIDELAHSDKIKIINIDLNFSNSLKSLLITEQDLYKKL